MKRAMVITIPGKRQRTKTATALVVAAWAAAFAAVCVEASSATTEPAGTQLPPRVLHFPPERSLGTLQIQDAGARYVFHPICMWEAADEPQGLGEARGDVSVPAGKRVILRVRPECRPNLRALTGLQPDDLHKLVLQAGPPGHPKVDDRCLPFIAHLTGLNELELQEAEISANGMRSLVRLQRLERLLVPDIGDTGLAGVAQLNALKSLRFGQLNRVTNDGLRQLARMRSLEDLYLLGGVMDRSGRMRPGPLNDAGLSQLAGAPALRHLGLAGAGWTDSGLAHLQKCPLLRRLDLSGLPITDAGLANLSRVKRLEALSLFGTKVTDAGLVHLKTLPSLRQLNVGATAVTDKGLVHLKAILTLECLWITNVGAEEALANLATLRNLRHLTLGLDSKVRLTKAGSTDLGRLKRLEKLEIANAQGVTDATLANLARLPDLKVLKLIFADSITNDGLAELKAAKSLEEFSLYRPKAGIAGLTRLREVPNLRFIDVKKIPPDGTALHLGRMDRLETLSLFKNGESFHDSDLAGIAGLSGLKNLYLFPAQFTDEGMRVLSDLSDLEVLDIGGRTLTDAGLAHLGKLKHLRSLKIRKGNITDAGLRHLENLKSLRDLHIESDSACNNAAIARLRASLPNLIQLRVTP